MTTPRDKRRAYRLAKQARALRRAGDIDGADVAIAEALGLDPDCRAALAEGANIDWSRKAWASAASRYDSLIGLDPASVSLRVYVRSARSWLQLSRPGIASKRLAAARAVFPNDAQLVTLSAAADIARGEGDRVMRYVLPYVAASGIAHRRVHAGLHRLLFRRGHAHEAYALKAEAARVYAQTERPRNAAEKLQRAAAHGYLGDFERARASILADRYERWPRPGNAEQFRRYCDLMVGLDPHATFEALYHAETQNPASAPTADGHWSREDFRARFAGRSIAIVGPADTRQDLREEIDGFDIVVRNNVFAASDLNYAAEQLGRRVDVSYYTGATFFRRKHELFDFARSSGVIPVLRRASNLPDARAAGIANARICSPSPPNFLPNFNNMHSVQRILWDLLKFGPSRVKLFNVTFYAGAMYSPGYRPRNNTPSITSLGLSHDPLQGFRFTRNLLARGIIEADPVATDILAWPEDRYIDLLQRDYASHWRPPKRIPPPT